MTDLGSSSDPLLFRGEQDVLEVRTTDPSNPEPDERWIRSDVAPETDQIATMRCGDGTDIPIFATGTATDTVRECRRVRVGGQTGYMPIAPPADASFTERRFRHNGTTMAYHDAVSPGAAIPDNAVNQWKYDEGDGSEAADSIGNIDATINGATWESNSDAVGGYWLAFDATDDYVSQSTIPSVIAPSNDWSICVTIDVADMNGDKAIFEHTDRSNDNNDRVACGIRDGVIVCGVLNDGSVSDRVELDVSDPSSDGIFRLGIGWDSSESSLKIYQNGTEQTTSSSASDVWGGNDGFRFGLDTGDNFPWDDGIDNPIVYESLLSNEEFSDDYEAQPYA